MSLRVLLVLLILLPLKAQALSCWMTSGATINFGTLAAGEATATNTSVKFSCQANYGSTQYINVCLSSVEASPFKMMSTGMKKESSTPCCFASSTLSTTRRSLIRLPAAT